MRKLLLGLLATAAIAAPVAVATAGSASAETPGSMDTVTHAKGGVYTHNWTVDYTCGVTTDGKSIVNFTFAPGTTASGSGSGVVAPDGTGGGAFSFNGVNGTYDYHYTGVYNASGAWTEATATAPDGSYNFGDVATDANFGSIASGSFTGIPNCATPEVKGNHGQYVSGATHAGIKGKDLAAIAKDLTKVGPYPG